MVLWSRHTNLWFRMVYKKKGLCVDFPKLLKDDSFKKLSFREDSNHLFENQNILTNRNMYIQYLKVFQKYTFVSNMTLRPPLLL